jgi:ribonuclease P protein component
MIDRTHRFHGHNALRFVYQQGRVVRGPLTTLKYLHNPKRQEYRLAVVVSKKVSKSAVVRNRIRRRVYEVVRLCETRISGPFDLVFTVFNESVATMPYAELETLVHLQLKQAGTLEVPHRSKAPNP